MPTVEYSLFRANFIKAHQPSLFDADLESEAPTAQVFLAAIREKPSVELGNGSVWHLGNIQLFSGFSGYFAVGRTTKSTIEKFDETSRDFLEEELDASPYTHCVFDTQLGILGIARKTSLAPTVKGIASKIQLLLAATEAVTLRGIAVEVSPIPDPQGFLSAVESAYRVFRFAATFRGPNPFDADEYFQKPLSVYLAAVNGKKGKAQVQGDDLDRATLQAVTRSTAATGNEASATLAREQTQKAVTIHLRGDAVKRAYDEEQHDPKEVLEDLRKLYTQVRNT